MRASKFRFQISSKKPKNVSPPSFIAMLSNRASAMNNGHIMNNNNSALTSSKSPKMELTTVENTISTNNNNKIANPTESTSSSINQPVKQQQQSHNRNPAVVLSQLSVLKSKYQTAEIDRRQELARKKAALKSIRNEIETLKHETSSVFSYNNRNNQTQAIVSDENGETELQDRRQIEQELFQLSKTQYNLVRKINRESIASSEQRKILIKVVQLLKSKHLKQSLDDLLQVSSHNVGGSSFVANSTFCEFVSAIGFFSGALRKVKKLFEYQQTQQHQQHQEEEEEKENTDKQRETGRTHNAAAVVVHLHELSLIRPVVKKKISDLIVQISSSSPSFVDQEENQQESQKHQTSLSMTPKQIITLLFNATKSGLIRRQQKEKNLAQNELLQTLLTKFHPSSFSAWDTLQLTMWLTAMTTSLATTTEFHPTNQKFFAQLYRDLLLKHLWIQNAIGLKGISSWLILSCIPLLDERLAPPAASSSSSTQREERKVYLDLKNQVVSTLVAESTKMLNAPVNSTLFTEAWNKNKQLDKGQSNISDDAIFGIKPARVDLLEHELSTKLGDAQKLMNILSLINNDSVKKSVQKADKKSLEHNKNRVPLYAQLSIGRAVVYGSLARLFQRILEYHTQQQRSSSSSSSSAGSSSSFITFSASTSSLLQDSSLLLLVASGPALESSNIDSRLEAASIGNLIDCIYLQLFQMCEGFLASSSTISTTAAHKKARNEALTMMTMDDAVASTFAVALVRGLMCLSHLTKRGFLIGKRKDDFEQNSISEGDSFLKSLRKGVVTRESVPQPKSRILTEFTTGTGILKSTIKTANGELVTKAILKISKEQLVSHFFKTLVMNPICILEQHFLFHQHQQKQHSEGGDSTTKHPTSLIDTVESALFELEMLTNNRRKELDRLRMKLGTDKRKRVVEKLIMIGEEAEGKSEEKKNVSNSNSNKTPLDVLNELKRRQLTMAVRTR